MQNLQYIYTSHFLVAMILTFLTCYFLLILLCIRCLPRLNQMFRLSVRNQGCGNTVDKLSYSFTQSSYTSKMGRTSKCVVVGMKGIGKTTMLEQLIYGNLEHQDIHPTIEDIYAALIDTDRGTKEGVRFYDTEGVSAADSGVDIALPRHYHAIADAFVLVYSVDSRQSFEIIDILKKDIEKNREKKEVIIVLMGLVRKASVKREVDPSFAVSWATREKIRHFEVSVSDRKNLVAPFTYLASKLNPPPTKSTFAPLGMVSRNKVKE